MNELPAGELQMHKQDQPANEISLSDAFEKALTSIQREAREVPLMLERMVKPHWMPSSII